MQINDEYQLLHIHINPQLLILPFESARHSWPYKPTYRKCICQKKTQWIFAPSNQTIAS